MKKVLKKYFIPHQENDHQPHILRIEAAMFMLSLVLFAETLFLIQAVVVFRYTDALASIIVSVLTDETNLNRTERDLSALSTNTTLEEAARLKAEDMAEKGYFAHTTPDGKSPWYWLDLAEYHYLAAGENLAVNFVDSKDVVEAWMDSPGHRANILNEKYSEIGIATARGKYKGEEAVFVVQFFGKPASAAAKTEPVQPAPIVARETVEKPEPEKVQEMSVEVQEVEVGGERIEEKDLVVAEEETEAQEIEREASPLAFIKRALANPKVSVDFLLIVLATIVSLALLLKIFVSIKIQHPPLIINGVLLLIIIASSLLINQYISLLGTEIV